MTLKFFPGASTRRATAQTNLHGSTGRRDKASVKYFAAAIIEAQGKKERIASSSITRPPQSRHMTTTWCGHEARGRRHYHQTRFVTFPTGESLVCVFTYRHTHTYTHDPTQLRPGAAIPRRSSHHRGLAHENNPHSPTREQKPGIARSMSGTRARPCIHYDGSPGRQNRIGRQVLEKDHQQRRPFFYICTV